MADDPFRTGLGRDAVARLLRDLDAMVVQAGGREALIPEDMSFLAWCEDLGRQGLKVDGKPFRLDNRPALRPIYEAIPSTRTAAHKLILIIMKATQLGLTVWEVLANLYMAAKWEPVSIGMFMPDQATASFKSEHRFMRIVRSAPELYKLLLHKPSEQAQRRQSEGNILTRTLRESLLMFLWTSGKVTTESRPMDITTLDEVQEMSLDEIDKVHARMGDSDVELSLLLSTANLPDLDIHFWYLIGTQEVWHSRCGDCGAASDLSDPAGIFPGRSIAYNHNGGKYSSAPKHEYLWTCPACAAWIPDPQTGEYIAQNPGADPRKRSFLLPRTISPRVTPRDLFERWQRAKTGDQKKSFYNRTLARPYIDAEQLPVTMAHCLACAEEGMRIGLTWKPRAKNTYMGIDQMGGFHCVIIKQRLPDGRQATVHIEAVFINPTPDDPDASPWRRSAELMHLYGVVVCVVEQLPNVDAARSFCNKFPGRAFMAGYANLRDDMMVWGDDLTKSDKRTVREDRSRYTVVLHQYKAMQTALFRIRDQLCLFPDPDALEQDVQENGITRRIPICRDWLFVHLTKTALVVEEKEDERKPRGKVLKIGIDPHFAFANMLCDVAWARSHGTASIMIPEIAPLPTGPNDTVLSAAPQPLPVTLESLPRGHVCGRCREFDAVIGLCTLRNLEVRASDLACDLFTPGEKRDGHTT